MGVSFPEPRRAWAAQPAPARFPTRAATSPGSAGPGPSNLAVIKQGKSKPCWVASTINVSQLRREVFQMPNSDVISNNPIYVRGARGPSMAPASPPLPWLLPGFYPQKKGGKRQMWTECWGRGGQAAQGTPAGPAQQGAAPTLSSERLTAVKKILKSLIASDDGGYRAFNQGQGGTRPPQSHPRGVAVDLHASQA